MITNKTISLTDLLRDFNAGLTKQAEDVDAALAPAPAPVTAPAAEVCPECGQSPCVCECPEGECATSETDAMQEAAATVNEKQTEAVDAAKALQSMADEYIAKHDSAIQKEAAVFGEIFAQAAYDTMKKQAAAEEAYSTTMGYFNNDEAEPEFDFSKQAEEAYNAVMGYFNNDEAEPEFDFSKQAEEAYNYTLCKLAAEEAYAAVASPEAAAAQAVSDSAAAAKALVEHITNKSDAEAAAGSAAAQAYQATMDQLAAQPTEDEQAAAAQDAYNEAAAQLQAQAQPDPQMAAASQNAYDTAMAQLAAQQQAPQA